MMRNDCLGVREMLARRLKILRQAAGHPLKRLALELGIPLSTAYAWEKGTRFPSAENLEKIAQWYAVQPCQLLTLDCDHDLSTAHYTKSGK